MRMENLVAEIEILRAEMVKYYLTADFENAIKTSQTLDKKIFVYLTQTSAASDCKSCTI